MSARTTPISGTDVWPSDTGNVESGWVPTRAGPVFAALHRPVPKASPNPAHEGSAAVASTLTTRETAVLLVPPFGWEAMSSARSLRVWAGALAAAGYPTVRLHLPGSGDSAGAAAEQDLSSWAAGVGDVIGHARAATGCPRVALIALGLGGFVALQAVAEGADVQDLVLWATPSRGRLLLRELRAFAALTTDPGDYPYVATAGPHTARGGTAQPAVPAQDSTVRQGRMDGDVLWVHGYPLAATAQEQLASRDLADPGTNVGAISRTLVLGRGSLPYDARLVTALTIAGIEASGEPGPGYDAMTVEPRLSQPPTDVMARVRAWLDAGSAGVSRAGLDEPVGTVKQAWPVADHAERQLQTGAVSVVLTPASDRAAPAGVTVVFVGAGAIQRSGPNRMWAEAARRWADWGIASLRADLAGIGEAGGVPVWAGGPDGFYEEPYRPQVRSLLGLAVQQGLPERFLLVGLCSGGLWAAQTALDDDRVVGVVVLNTEGLVWPPPLAALSARERFAHLTRRQTWQPLVHDRAARRDALGRVRRSVRLARDRWLGAPAAGSARAPASSDQVVRALDRRGVRVTVGASPGEPLLLDLAGLSNLPHVEVRALDGRMGAHTLSPPGLREQAERLLDDAARLAMGGEQG